MTCSRTIFHAAMIFAGLILLASLVHLNAPPRAAAEDKPAPAPSEPPRPGEIRTIRLTLHPAPEPRPALKYLLLPPRPELETGNAAVHYYALTYAQGEETHDQKKLIEDALAKPLSELTRASLPPVLMDRWVGRELGRATRRTYCDWQLASHEGITMVLPALGIFRRQGSRLAIDARLLIAEGRFDEALSTLQTAMMLGRHVGQDLTLIQGLVGLKIHSMAIDRVEEWIGQPDAPNLYWALTNLPRPMIDFSTVTQLESHYLEASIPQHLRAAVRTRALGVEEAEALLSMFVNYANGVWDSGNKVDLEALQFHQAPARLIETVAGYGYNRELLNKMPAAQVHVLFLLERHRELTENQSKWFGVPYRESRAALAQAVPSERLETHRLVMAFTGDLTRVALLNGRFERKVAALRVIEAIRMYAAENDGKLPAALDAITSVPLPDDPMTGRPFVYRVEGQTASLELIDGDDELRQRYELTMAR